MHYPFVDAESNEKSCGCNVYLKKVGLKKKKKKGNEKKRKEKKEKKWIE